MPTSSVNTKLKPIISVCFFRFIEGREIRCAVVESDRTGQLKALSCLEYNIRQDDIRKTEDKLLLNEMGLPLGMY